MSLTHFSVNFDYPQAVYTAGQQVTGHVTVRLAREKRLRGIEIKFKGRAEVHWDESRSTTNSDGQSETVTDSYRANETYFRESFYVVGGPNGEMTLPPGEHAYKFVLVLPSNIPSSFESTYGHVRYTVQGIINRPWRFDHKCKGAFTVISLLDLNTEMQYQECMQQVKEKELGCCCRGQPPVSLVVTLPSRGFVPGQRCTVTSEVDNPTDNGVTLKCSLVQAIKYTASSKTTKNVRSNKVVIGEDRMYASRRSRTWTTNLEIPSLPPSYLRYCKYIDIYYSIEVRGAFTGLHRDIVVEIPILIGSIPFRTHFSSIAPSAPVEDNDADRAGFSAPDSPLSSYPDMPPPSYKECVSGKVNIRDKDDDKYVQGDLIYSPSYPVYRFTFQ